MRRIRIRNVRAEKERCYAAAKFAWPQIIDNIFCFSTACYCILLCSYCIHWYLCTTHVYCKPATDGCSVSHINIFLVYAWLCANLGIYVQTHTHTHKFYGTHIYIWFQNRMELIYSTTIYVYHLYVHIYKHSAQN